MSVSIQFLVTPIQTCRLNHNYPDFGIVDVAVKPVDFSPDNDIFLLFRVASIIDLNNNLKDKTRYYIFRIFAKLYGKLDYDRNTVADQLLPKRRGLFLDRVVVRVVNE